MAASAPCICVCLDAAAGAGVIAASQARGQHGRVGVGQVQSQVPMSLQFSSSSSSAIRRGPARVRPGSGQDQESQLAGDNGTCEGRQASAVEDVCLTLGLSGGWLMLPQRMLACLKLLDTLIRLLPHVCLHHVQSAVSCLQPVSRGGCESA
ncbi:hypothetical protein H0G86_000950 [Trichoderma simmonsii]|uniref:Uncharacterized protein n=1 Tax=Trichoderma simmonsii TaxID=1491479 RepID=A0A8G0L3Q2_9HYPO|nr:hypothetical protein H0G86_000950 [Trichoderma simmonsii]